ncbi:MAG: VTT domain-containing protein [Phycisphaerales bacterium]|nr:VTT domain-containing protein [Phycisphaerales bacterium]
MSSVVDNESHLQNSATQTPPQARKVVLDLYEETQSDQKQSGCQSNEDCSCNECSSNSTSLFGAAACVMVGASAHASEKSARKRLGAQSLHWGVLFVGALISLPIVMPTLSQSSQDWIVQNLLISPGNWKLIALSVFATGLFAMGFVSRLGRERVLGGCAMLKRLGPAAVLGVAWSTVPSFAGVMLVLNMEPIRLALIGDGVSAVHIASGMSIYLVGFVLLAGFGCLPTVSQAILAGYAFGVPVGLGLALAGFGGASLVGYSVVSKVARSRVEQELVNKPKAKLLRDALLHASPKQALLIVTLVRVSPSSPFALTNLLLASLGVPRKIFFMGTVIGMLPRTLAAVLIGQQFTGWNGGIDKPQWLIIAGIIAIIVLVIVISKVAANALLRVARSTDHESAPTVFAS